MPYRRPLISDFIRAQKEHPDFPVVMSEGDSWFSFADVIGQLDDPKDTGSEKDQRAWALLRLEKAGDEVLTILSGAQRAKLRGHFERFRLDALLFSGGGNDIIGPDLLPLLREFKPGAAVQDLVQFSRFERRLRQVQDCYRELLDILTDAGQTCPIFANSYDFVEPSKKGAELLGFIRVSGPWVLPYLEQRRIPKAMHGEVIALLINAFASAIDAVAAEPRGVGRLVRVETRDVVKGEWKDEIHPNTKGAKRVAKAFETALKSAGVI
jgi:lysophospholipase L1-like esterase